MWTTGFYTPPCLNKFHKLQRDPQAFHIPYSLQKGQGRHLLLRQEHEASRLQTWAETLALPQVPQWLHSISVCLLSWFYTWVWSKPCLGADFQFTGPVTPRKRGCKSTSDQTVVLLAWFLHHYHLRTFKKCTFGAPPRATSYQQSLIWEVSPPGDSDAHNTVREPLDWTKTTFKKFAVPNTRQIKST